MARARRVGRVARALVAACGETAPAADPIRPPQAPTWTSRPSFRSAPLARVRAFHSIPYSAASRAAAPTLALVPGAPRLPSRLRDHPARATRATRSYFAGHPQIRNAEGQDMAQVRAGVRLRKALCAVLEHPSMSHRFENTGLTILEVRMAKDFKKAHVRWTVADGDDDADEETVARHLWDGRSHFLTSSSFSARKRSASAALRREATRLRSMASKMLRSKHTPRLVFVDDDAKSAQERALDAAFDRAAEAEAGERGDAAEGARAKPSTSRPSRKMVRTSRASRTGFTIPPTLTLKKRLRPTTTTVRASAWGTRSRRTTARRRTSRTSSTRTTRAPAAAAAATTGIRRVSTSRRGRRRCAPQHRPCATPRRPGSRWGDAAALDDGGFDADFDDAVDALVAEMAATGDAGADADAEAAIRAAAARARLQTEQEDEEEEEGEWFDDDDEYVEGDEFDDDDDEEAEDFHPQSSTKRSDERDDESDLDERCFRASSSSSSIPFCHRAIDVIDGEPKPPRKRRPRS